MKRVTLPPSERSRKHNRRKSRSTLALDAQTPTTDGPLGILESLSPEAREELDLLCVMGGLLDLFGVVPKSESLRIIRQVVERHRADEALTHRDGSVDHEQ
jgi:hypothetical protein